MDQPTRPFSVDASAVPPRAVPSSYPPRFAARLLGREKRALGDVFGLRNFGVNVTRLPPGASSALHHAHARQDEFIYVLDGTPTLVRGEEEQVLGPGMCAGFAAGTGEAHHLVNRSNRVVVILEVGDRSPGDTVAYPDDDIAARLGADGKWSYTRKDGSAF